MPSPQENSNALLASSHPGLGKLLAHNDVLFALALAAVLATLLIPLPTFLVDLLLSVSVAISLGTMVVVLSTREPIEFSTFPSLLLFVTLFRLSLNVASTRLILIQGDAGRIIETFGNFVVGGNLVVGLVIFLILVIIQFVVITKGAERISEVSARFNLDAMPGKQMAIDADLSAGLIGEQEARERRTKIVRESEFYGAMDGASKFIRGDAIASLIITAVNLIGGFVVGMVKGLTPQQSITTYAILAIGDGLVTQIPALLVSTASGFLVSKTATQSSLSSDLARQLLSRSKPVSIAAFLLGAMVFVPGFPVLPFAGLSLGAALLARRLSRYERELAKPATKPKTEDTEAPVEELLDVDRLSVQVGPRLIKTVDPRRTTSLSHRIAPLRRKFAQQYGIILPLVRLRDNMTLDPNTYEIRLHNHVVGTGKLEPDLLMAMDPGTVSSAVPGQPANEPVFNLPALWIKPEQKEKAELAGYTVVDPETVMVTHLGEVLRRHAWELLGRDDVQKLVERLREKQPALVNSVVDQSVPMALLHRVLQHLLRDGLPVRDLAQILEALGDHAARTKDPAMLTELVRKVLVRTITEQNTDTTGGVSAITLEPSLEYELRKGGEGEGLALGPERTMELVRQVGAAWKRAMDLGLDKVVLLCDAKLRPQLAGLLSRQIPQLPVVAYDEIALGTRTESVATVSLPAGAEAALTS